MDKAVILARGLGTRMRKADDAARLTAEESAAADAGAKAMMPVGRPFLDYVLSAVADAGYRRACLVVAPEHGEIRDYYDRLGPRRIGIEYAVQDEPRGTADAVATAERFAAGEPFLAVNSDNYYPAGALRALRERLRGSGLAAFDRDGLLGGNIPPDRIARFAIVQTDAAGRLVRIIEKPDEGDLAAVGEPIRVSMNCWRLEPSIFAACRAIGPSSRGEYELPYAVQYAVDRLGVIFTALDFRLPVLDLSCRADVPGVKLLIAGMAGMEVNL